VAVTIVWLVLLATGALWEIVCHLSHGRWTSLTALVKAMANRLPGKLVLIAAWAFVGWHLFARYTLPR
jgi:Family of unknown function (DUF6186)